MNVPHPDSDELVLAALPAEPGDPDVAAHLRGCAQCRAEVDALRATVDLAREGADAMLPAPPPRVWQGIVTELGLHPELNGRADHVTSVDGVAASREPRAPQSGPEPPDGASGPPLPDAATVLPDPRRDHGRAIRRPHRLRRVLVPVLAALVGLVAGLGIERALTPAGPPSGVPPVAGPVGRLAPVGDLDPAASGTIAMAASGERRMVVQVQGVTNLDGGDHLEAWLMDPSGTRIIALGALDGGNGAFHGTFALPDGLPLAEFDRVDVSAERWDGDPAHSTISVLRGATP